MFFMIEKTPKYAWNPEGALAAFCDAQHYGAAVDRLEHGLLARHAGGATTQQIQKVGETEDMILSQIEYARQQRDLAIWDHFRQGGPEATRVALGQLGLTQYAGEPPPLPNKPAPIVQPNYPA